jgi:hypothetical protein
MMVLVFFTVVLNIHANSPKPNQARKFAACGEVTKISRRCTLKTRINKVRLFKTSAHYRARTSCTF